MLGRSSGGSGEMDEVGIFYNLFLLYDQIIRMGFMIRLYES